MSEEIIVQDPQGQSTETQDPAGQAGQSTQSVQTDNLPEKFKGKSAEDIAKSYLELEKTIGKHSGEVNKVRDELAQYKRLEQILEADPELYKQVSSAIDKFSGQNTSTTVNEKDSKPDDTRLALENTIINDFEKNHRISSLEPDKRLKLQTAIGQELLEILDPGGSRTIRQVLDTIPLNKLDNYLNKAYRLVASSDDSERERAQAVAVARQNSEASFGSMPSASLARNENSLSEEEKKVAKKMGISEDKYLKNKIELNK